MSEEQFDKLIDVFKEIAGGQLHGPSGIEGLAMAIAGKDFVNREQSLAGAVQSVADVLERIALVMEAGS